MPKLFSSTWGFALLFKEIIVVTCKIIKVVIKGKKVTHYTTTKALVATVNELAWDRVAFFSCKGLTLLMKGSCGLLTYLLSGRKGG